MQKSFILFLALIAMAFLHSCYYDVESELYPACELPESVSYSVDIEPIITSSCAISGCHVQGGSGPGNFANYNNVKAKVDDGTFVNEVVIDRTMPPSGGLSDCDRQLLELWVDSGAPNN
jgi:hypothetical protein